MHWCAKERNAKWDSCSGGVTLSDKLGIAASALSFESVTSQFQFSKAEAVPFKNSSSLRSLLCLALYCSADAFYRIKTSSIVADDVPTVANPRFPAAQFELVRLSA